MFVRPPNRNSLLGLGLLLIHLTVPVGLWFALRIGRPRFVGLALYITVTVLFVDVLLLLGGTSNEIATSSNLDVRVPTITLLASGGIVALFGQGIVFYVSMTLTILLILFGVLTQKEDSTTRFADLALISGTSILLFSSKVFTVAYFVSSIDTINHTTATIVLLNGKWLSAISATRYFSFPSFHLLASTGIRFTQLSPRLFISILVIGLFQIALLALFLFFRNWGQSQTLALFGTVLVSINIAFLRYGANAHYQSMAFVLVCVFLMLLSREQWSIRYVAATMIILLTLITTHHVSVLMVLALLFVPIGYLGFRIMISKHKQSDQSTILMFMTFCLMFLAYWAVVTNKFREVVIWVFFTSGAAEGIPSRVYLVTSFSSIDQVLVEAIPFFIDSVHYSFLLSLACVGVVVLIKNGLLNDVQWHIIFLGFLPAAILYFPNPAWVPLEGTIPFARWRLMVLPFLMLVPAAGLRYLIRETDRSQFRRASVVLFAGALVFTTITSGMSNPGLTELASIEKGTQDHLSDEELAATEFVFTYINDHQHVFSRADLVVYLHRYAWAEQKPFTEDQFKYIRANYTERQMFSQPGLNIVSIEAFRSKGIRAQIVGLNSTKYGDYLPITPIHASNYHWSRTNSSTIYTNGPTVIQYEEASGSSRH